ncbi:MAG: DNA-processing protein DprA [Candidatus Thorarchaeota archaeon]|nr:DNA-processing protein DprA [Candidatus Thorarchaeota archaeon]
MNTADLDRRIEHYAAWLALSSVKECDYETAIEILRQFESFEKALQYHPPTEKQSKADEIILRDGTAQRLLVRTHSTPQLEESIIDKVIAKARNYVKEIDYRQMVKRILQKGIEIHPIIGQGYPRALFDLENPPRTLFVRGNILLDRLDNAIAIVGTRNPTEYGKKMAYTLAKALAQRGYIIISGLAFGVDEQAHTGALDADGGKTIAVLPSYVEKIVPMHNSSLANKILQQGGALISEYPPHTKVRNYMFVQRNRIIAALSRATIIIEGRTESGTRHQARFAMSMKRPLFVLRPVHPEMLQAELPLHLINEGAIPISDADEIEQSLEVL